MEIKSVNDFMKRRSANPLLKKEGTTVFYRGVNNIYPAETRHIPGLYYPPNRFYENEDNIFKEVISIFPDEMLAQRLTVEKLFLMQHYRFPTRIMDISKNPLVDLFFACFADKGLEDFFKEDGVVYVYAVPTEEIKFSDSDKVSILANLCKRPNDFSVKDIFHLDRDAFNREEAVQYLVYDIQEEKPHFLPLIQPRDIGSVVCLRPRMNNPRIIRQDGYFFLFGVSTAKRNTAPGCPRSGAKTRLSSRRGTKRPSLKNLKQWISTKALSTRILNTSVTLSEGVMAARGLPLVHNRTAAGNK